MNVKFDEKKKNEMKCSERAWTQRMLEKLYRRERHQITDKYVVEKKIAKRNASASSPCIRIRFGGLSVSAVRDSVNGCTNVFGVFRALVVCRRMRSFSFSVCVFFSGKFFPASTGLATFLT